MTNDKHDRDATVGRLLKGAMPRGSEEASAACLDADTLAAWTDGALNAGELAAAEAHAADCARCQAMLAAMAKTAPAAPAAAAAPWWMSSLRWLVPLTAAAAAVFVWSIVPLRDGPANIRQVSQSDESIAAPPSPAQPPSPAPARDAGALPSAPADSERARREQQTPAEAKDLEVDKKNALSRQSAEGAKADASADTSALTDATAKNADVYRRSADGARADSAKADLRLKAPTASENAAAAPAAPTPPLTRTFSFGAPETVIVSSNPASRWRILQGGAVQRSSDGGATWQTQSTGVTETLSRGSSPSPSVCWLVGPKGIVLRSTDGRSWTRVPFPEVVELSAIHATDDQTATVTTADGRQFVTEDGGRTWTRAPGL